MARTTVHPNRPLIGLLFLLFAFLIGSHPVSAQVSFSTIGGTFQSDAGVDNKHKTARRTTALVNFLDNGLPNSNSSLALFDRVSGNLTVLAPGYFGSNDELKLGVVRAVIDGRGRFAIARLNQNLGGLFSYGAVG